MKNKTIISICQIFLGTIIITWLCILSESTSNLNKKIDALELILEKKTVRDSLVAEHYRTCSFIAKNQIEIGHDNYLRVKSNEIVYNNIKKN